MKPYWMSGIGDRDPFSFDAVYRFPDSELRAIQPGRGTRVCIIGAGVAGLAAAYELSSHGFKVVLLELSDRIGGRIKTYRFKDGTHAELGAMRIPGNHACSLHYVDAFGIGSRRFINYNSAAFYRLRGRQARLADWRTIATAYDLRAPERRDPVRLLEEQMSMAMGRLSAQEKYQLFHSRSPGIVEEYDNRTLRQHLEANRLSQDAIEYVGNATGLVQYERASFLETLIDYFGLLRVDQIELVNGMSALVDAFAGRVGHLVKLECKVCAVSVASDKVVVHYVSANKAEALECDYVICTAPARQAAAIDWSPTLPPRQLEAMRRLYYASSVKTIVRVDRRVWETDQGIFGGGSFSDEPFQQIWYPSDNARALDATPLHALVTGDDLDETATSSAPSEWGAISTETSAGPGVITASYTWENNARYMASLDLMERTEVVLNSLEKLHPSIRGHVTDVEHMVWDAHTGTGGGTFAYYAPGEHSRYFEPLTSPHPVDRPRVFFAGEHVSVVHAWIQGSIQSALQAVLDLAANPRSSASNT